MKKQFWFLGLCVAALLVACNKAPKDGHIDTPTSGTIKIAADASFEPIIQEELDVFAAQFPETKIVPIYTTEVDAVNLLIKDTVRFVVAARDFTKAELDGFHSRKFDPRSIRLAYDGLALIVHKSNKDTLISVKNIRDVLTGKISRWNQIYPHSSLGAIQVVFDNKNSSTVRFAIDSICHGKPLSMNQVKAVKTSQQVIDYVAKTPNAIGVVGVNWLGNRKDTTHLSFLSDIQVMAVSNYDVATPSNSYKPYQAYFYYGSYPLTRSIYILLNDPRNCLPWALSAFMTNDRGQLIILKSGLLPATQNVRVREVHVKDE